MIFLVKKFITLTSLSVNKIHILVLICSAREKRKLPPSNLATKHISKSTGIHISCTFGVCGQKSKRFSGLRNRLVLYTENRAFAVLIEPILITSAKDSHSATSILKCFSRIFCPARNMNSSSEDASSNVDLLDLECSSPRRLNILPSTPDKDPKTTYSAKIEIVTQQADRGTE